MVDLDTKDGGKLTAQLNEELDELNVTIRLLEERIRNTPFSVAGNVKLWKNAALWWKKHNGAWGLYIVGRGADGPNTTALISTNMQTRTEAVKRIPELIDVLCENINSELARVEEANRTLDGILRSFDEAGITGDD